MSRTPLFVTLLLLAAAGPAAAQAPAPAKPPPQPPERTTAPRESGLNLKLDEADLRALSRDTSAPRDQPGEKGAGSGGLPSLGGDARTFERPSALPGVNSSTGPYPKDTENINR